MIISRRRVKYWWHCVTTLLSDQNIHIAQITSNCREIPSCQPRRHSDKSGAERERCFKFNSNPSISRDPPAQNLTFSIILSHSGSTLSNNPGTAVKSNELRLMWWSNFTQKQFSFKLLRYCDDVHRMFNTTFIRTKVVIINFTSSNLKWAWEGGGRTVTRIPGPGQWSPVSAPGAPVPQLLVKARDESDWLCSSVTIRLQHNYLW